MPEEAKISKCKRYIEICSHGTTNPVEVKDAITKVVFIYKGSGIDKVIVNSKNRNETPSAADALEVGKFLADATEGKIKFAILVNEEAILNQLTKTAAEFHGGLIAYFKDIAAAKNWLKIK
jgi:hypothetical protein